MVVVAGGASTRFGADKLMVKVHGDPLIAHTIRAVRDRVDHCVVVCRHDLVSQVEQLGLDVLVVPGGETRTDSEMAGLGALRAEHDLIGIHDGARPLVSSGLIEELFETANEHGGAVPVLETNELIIDRHSLLPLTDIARAQTPQVFRGPQLLAAYVRAAQTVFQGHDTVEVVEKFSDLRVVRVAGDPDNVKVTVPSDLEKVRSLIPASSRNEAQ